MEIYKNNDVSIEFERVDEYETKVNVNGENLIYIDSAAKYVFEKELSELLDKYRI